MYVNAESGYSDRDGHFLQRARADFSQALRVAVPDVGRDTIDTSSDDWCDEYVVVPLRGEGIARALAAHARDFCGDVISFREFGVVRLQHEEGNFFPQAYEFAFRDAALMPMALYVSDVPELGPVCIDESAPYRYGAELDDTDEALPYYDTRTLARFASPRGFVRHMRCMAEPVEGTDLFAVLPAIDEYDGTGTGVIQHELSRALAGIREAIAVARLDEYRARRLCLSDRYRQLLGRAGFAAAQQSVPLDLLSAAQIQRAVYGDKI